MNWRKFLGESLYRELKEYCADRNISLASAVRNAVAEYVKKG